MHHQTPSLALTILLLAGLAPVASGMQPGPGTPAPRDAMRVVSRALDLQPGDSELMRGASENPLAFVAIAGERELRGELIVHAKAGRRATGEARVQPLTLRSSAFVPERVVRVPDGMTEGQLAAMLMATGDYEFVEPNWTLFPIAEPDDPQFSSSWQHNRIDSRDAWDIETGEGSIVVAVCDSGVDLDHPDLVDTLVPGFNSASNRAQVDGGEVDDINGHGTFVAGCSAARGNNGVGVTGVGWDLSVMPVRVTNNTNGTASAFAILDGARWAAVNGAQIINVSFSGGTSASNQSAARFLKEQGSLMFWAAGNDGAFIEPNRPDYVVVGSTTSSDSRSGFSNFGPAVDVVAPGSGVRSTQRGGGYGNSSGTSFASPIAAGVGAMIYSVNPDLIPDDVQDILYNSVDDLGATGRDDFFGRGRVNTFRAVQLAQSYARPSVLPISLGFEDGAWQDLFSADAGDVNTVPDADAPEGDSVLRLQMNGSLVSERLAGRTLFGDAMLSFEARSMSLAAGDALQVQYLLNPETAGEDSWATLVQLDIRGEVNERFVRHNLEMPSEMQWHGVRLRFVADSAQDGAWFIDDLSLDLMPESDAPLDQDFEGQSIDPVAWLITTNTEPVFDAGTFAAELSDNATLQSRDIPLLQFGFVEPFLNFDAWVDDRVNPDDTLTVDVKSITGDWLTLAEIRADELSGSPRFIDLEMPVFTWALDDMQLRFKTDTQGAFLLDNIYLGVEPPSGACNDADLAEPFGVLNFFDVSAFLGAFNAGDASADLNNDGETDFFDVSSFLTQFNAGCP